MGEKIYNSNYLGDKNMREYNPFAEEYFTGSDIKLFANGTEIKQISMIQYELQEQLKPIYGYSSYVYDDIAVGSRIITGTFVCPMKNLANNDDFKCLPDKKYKPGSSRDIRDYIYTPDLEVNEDTKHAEYNIKISDTDVYLSPMLDFKILHVESDEAIVKSSGADYMYIYIHSINKFGYIGKEVSCEI